MYEKIKEFFKKHWKIIVGAVSTAVLFVFGRRYVHGLRGARIGATIRECAEIARELKHENTELGERIEAGQRSAEEIGERLDRSEEIARELKHENTELGNEIDACRNIIKAAKERSAAQ